MGGNIQENIVIGGISGRWPESRNVEEFMENLLDGVDMIGSAPISWNATLNNLPTRIGRLGNLDKFDADFFHIGKMEANSMDPRLRILLEVTHEAIFDAGFNPSCLRGSKTGVFVGASGEESRMFSKLSNEDPNLHLGSALSMLPNQISFRYDLRGPSLSVDTACSSSLAALNQAFINIRSGRCDSAVVASVHLNLDPDVSKRYNQLGMLSADGKCKAFDASANGYVRSEAAVVVFICKESFGRRNYAKILNVNINADGHKEQGMTFPSGIVQEQLLRQTYDGAGVDPRSVVYVEAHGTGTAAGDSQEVNAIDRVFCTGRTNNSLLIGSVKSNLGHTEAAAGLTGIAKIILASQYRTIPGNLHFKNRNPSIPGIISGRLTVVDRKIVWKGGIVGVSSFGFGGANAHAILETNIANIKTEGMKLPKIIPFSATSSDAINFALLEVRDRERIGLLQLIHNENIAGHRFRGYCLPETSTIEIQEMDSNEASIKTWFVFAGIGSQWEGMGRDMLRFDVFQKSIQNSAEILKLCDIDLIGGMNGTAASTASSILYQTVCISAIQIALVDLLQSVGIYPDGIIGHSFGEVACAYADGCYSAKETLFTSWALFKAIIDSNLPPGAMASLGICKEDAKYLLPMDISIACYNAIDNISVSGSSTSIQKCVENLKSNGTFAREIDSFEYAFHSDLMKPAEARINDYLQYLNSGTRTRSPKWISTSQPSDVEKCLSSKYYSNNVLMPVCFTAAVAIIPDNSVVIEISPNGILQSILKRSLPKTCISVSLTKRSCDNAQFFLSAIGKLFNAGLQPQMQKLYPDLKFPLSSATLSLSPLIQWAHGECWTVPEPPIDNGGCIVEIDLSNPAHAFYSGYKINNRIVFPPSGYLLLIWRALAKNKSTTLDQPITFEDLEIKRVIFLDKQCPTKFTYNIQESGSFEILENHALIMTGSVRFEESEQFDMDLKFSKSDGVLQKSQFYDQLTKMCQEYSEIFQRLSEVEISGQWGKSIWRENWVSFIESMFQLETFAINLGANALLNRIDKISINPKNFKDKIIENLSFQPSEVLILRDEDLRLVWCKGIEIQGIKFKSLKSPQDLDNNENKCFEKILQNFKFQISNKLAEQNIIPHNIIASTKIVGSLNPFRAKECDIFGESFKSSVSFSGNYSKGQNIMGVLKFEASTAQFTSALTWPIPNSWPLPDAALIPRTYASAYYALVNRGRLRHYESVFIQCGSSALGQAAIAVALTFKCRVFTSTSSKMETQLLIKRFPALNSANIGNWKFLPSLEKLVLTATKGHGVNLVLNCLQGKFLQASIRCLAEYGRFIQLGRADLENSYYSSMGLSVFLRSISFHGVPFDVLASCGQKDESRIYELIQEGMQFGVVRPLCNEILKNYGLDEEFINLAYETQTAIEIKKP